MLPRDWAEGNTNVSVTCEVCGQSRFAVIPAFIPDRGRVQWELPSCAKPEDLNHEFPHLPPLWLLESSPAVGLRVSVLDWVKPGLVSPFSKIFGMK